MATIKVQLKGGREEIESPSMKRDEAEQQLQLIRATLGTGDTPDVPWLAVMGVEILAASVYDTWGEPDD